MEWADRFERDTVVPLQRIKEDNRKTFNEERRVAKELMIKLKKAPSSSVQHMI